MIASVPLFLNGDIDSPRVNLSSKSERPKRKQLISTNMTNYIVDRLNELQYSHFLEEHDRTLMYGDLVPVTEDGVPIRKLFISNLAERTTHKDLAKLFSKYGNVESCFLLRNQGRSNYAFLTFNSVDAAVRARCEEITLHNRNLRVSPADTWHQPDSIENQYYNTKDWQKSDWPNDRCNQNYIENDITDTSIQALNDDCLMHIFLQLPIVDRIRMERVCKRWRAVSQESWGSVKKLELSYSMWGFSSHSRLHDISISTLRKVLLRCGRFLTEIDLSQMRCQLNQSTLTVVGKLCPNLQSINVTALTVSASGINSLTNNCHDITKFSLGRTTSICDMDLEKLFKINQKLRYFRVVSSKICGRCLIHLPAETLEEIVLQRCTSLQEHFLLQAIARLKNLRNLVINTCVDISGNIIKGIGTHCTNLKIFELSALPPLLQPHDMLHIAQFTNLEVLKVNINIVVTDELLCNIASKCQQLTYIDISGCYRVSNIGITAVATLPKLEVLNMNNLYSVTDTTFKDMSNFKKLKCHACKFTDKAITELIKSAPQLELLDLSGCRGITNLTLKTAASVTVNRTNNKILKIFVGSTSVKLDEFDEVSPFLQIVNVDLSEKFILHRIF